MNLEEIFSLILGSTMRNLTWHGSKTDANADAPSIQLKLIPKEETNTTNHVRMKAENMTKRSDETITMAMQPEGEAR